MLKLSGFVLDMWSRHRDRLQAMACGGEIGMDEIQVVNHLGYEVEELLEMVVMEDSSTSEGSNTMEVSHGGKPLRPYISFITHHI